MKWERFKCDCGIINYKRRKTIKWTCGRCKRVAEGSPPIIQRSTYKPRPLTEDEVVKIEAMAQAKNPKKETPGKDKGNQRIIVPRERIKKDSV